MSNRPFWWIDGASFDQLRADMMAAPLGSRLETRIDEQQKLTHTVVPPSDVKTASTFGPINESHVCPPFCP